MPQWEYLTLHLQAEAKSQLEELRKLFPDRDSFYDYSPMALIPQLDELGEEGWELISIQPVFPGEQGNVMVNAAGPAEHYGWTHTYFCAFKRLREE